AVSASRRRRSEDRGDRRHVSKADGDVVQSRCVGGIARRHESFVFQVTEAVKRGERPAIGNASGKVKDARRIIARCRLERERGAGRERGICPRERSPCRIRAGGGIRVLQGGDKVAGGREAAKNVRLKDEIA